MGMVSGPHTKEAAAMCGRSPDQLCPGPLVATAEGDKIRTIYDGSWGGATAHIQANTVEKTTAPTVLDSVQAIHWLEKAKYQPDATACGVESGWRWPSPVTTWTLRKADVTKAHRRIKVLPKDWRYQVAQIKGSWWINRVGTYGMASAQLYWGRMAALLLDSFKYCIASSWKWTGAMSSWMTSVGFSAQMWTNTLHHVFSLHYLLWAFPLAGRKLA